MSDQRLVDVSQRKQTLKADKDSGVIDSDTYYLKLMDVEDDEILARIEIFDEDLRKEMSFSNNRSQDLMRTVGTLQRYNSELSKAKFNRHKANRYKEKVYNERYEYYKRGAGQVQLKNSHEYTVWISKDSRYSRTNSYCQSYDILIDYLEYAIKHLNSKVFALQALMKAVDYDLAPMRDDDRKPDE